MTYAVSSGWNPPRAWSAFILPFYFAGLLAVLTLSFVISGNTLMLHFRTGTVQRDTSPQRFWSIVAVQSLIAALLFVIGYINWRSFRG
jgi:ABC-type spermidine/putrescine transport system permease subunit II